MTNADGSTVSYTYDANGQVLSITDEFGEIAHFVIFHAGHAAQRVGHAD